MSNSSIPASAAIRKPAYSRAVRRTFYIIPLFTFLLLFYVVIELSVENVRSVIFTVGSYSLTWVEIIYLCATVMAMAELLRVSKPGIDNTKEALFMGGIWVVYLVLFLLGATRIEMLRIFNNTEFLILTLIGLSQVILAFMINARTLKRTIDYTGDDASADHHH
jgi:hypothetical protein